VSCSTTVSSQGRSADLVLEMFRAKPARKVVKHTDYNISSRLLWEGTVPQLKPNSGSGNRWFVSTHKQKCLGRPDQKLVIVANEISGACLCIGMFPLTDRNAEFNALVDLAGRHGPPDVLTTDTRALQGVLTMANAQWGNVSQTIYSVMASGTGKVARLFYTFTDFLSSPEYNTELPTAELNKLIDGWRREYNNALE
jgi:hypothetical protein